MLSLSFSIYGCFLFSLPFLACFRSCWRVVLATASAERCAPKARRSGLSAERAQARRRVSPAFSQPVPRRSGGQAYFLLCSLAGAKRQPSGVAAAAAQATRLLCPGFSLGEPWLSLA